MNFNEILWVIKALNLEPFQDLEITSRINIITSRSNIFTILSPTKRVDIISINDAMYDEKIVHRYIRVYQSLDNLSTYFQTDFDKYIGKPDIDIIKLYENCLGMFEGVTELNE